MKFHLKHDGMPAKCTATTRACPRGGEDDHFDSIVEAAKASEERNKPKEVPAAVKKVPLISRMNYAVGEINMPEDLKDEFRDNPEAYQDVVKELVDAREAAEANKHLPGSEKSKYNRKVSNAQVGVVRELIEGVNDHYNLPASVKDRVWTKAWEDGHSSGYSEVAMHFSDLADFASHAYHAGIEDENIRQAAL